MADCTPKLCVPSRTAACQAATFVLRNAPDEAMPALTPPHTPHHGSEVVTLSAPDNPAPLPWQDVGMPGSVPGERNSWP